MMKKIYTLQKESNALQIELNKRHSQMENIRRIFQQYWQTKGQIMGHQEHIFRTQVKIIAVNKPYCFVSIIMLIFAFKTDGRCFYFTK